MTISGTPNLSTRFLTFTGNALNFLFFGSKIRFQLHSISRQQFSLKTYDGIFRGGDLHICERSCALDVQTELHFWGIDDLHLEVAVLSSADLSRNSYSWAILPQGLYPKNEYIEEIFWTNVVLNKYHEALLPDEVLPPNYRHWQGGGGGEEGGGEGQDQGDKLDYHPEIE